MVTTVEVGVTGCAVTGEMLGVVHRILRVDNRSPRVAAAPTVACGAAGNLRIRIDNLPVARPLDGSEITGGGLVMGEAVLVFPD